MDQAATKRPEKPLEREICKAGEHVDSGNRRDWHWCIPAEHKPQPFLWCSRCGRWIHPEDWDAPDTGQEAQKIGPPGLGEPDGPQRTEAIMAPDPLDRGQGGDNLPSMVNATSKIAPPFEPVKRSSR